MIAPRSATRVRSGRAGFALMKIKNSVLNILTVLASLLIGVAVCELVLISIQWAPQKTTSDYLQFGYSTGVPVWDEDGVLEDARPVKIKLFEYDDELFWKTIPGTEFTNAQGFRGKQDVAVANPDNAIRILILGDSCSFLGRKLYADFLHEQLTQNHPEARFEIINASVPGYTSFQGKKALERLMQYKPHYACIYFGWNDHWILPSGYSDRFHYGLIHDFKVFQLAKIMSARLMSRREYRVPLHDYQANLTEMLHALAGSAVIPIMVAAPAGYAGQGMPSWAFDFYRQYYRMSADEIENIPATHQAYANVVAKLAKQHNAIFVDAQAYFNDLPAPVKSLFRNDLIHLTERGHQAMAQAIYQQIDHYNSANQLTWATLKRSKSPE